MLLKLIMLDESGDETVVETYNVRDDLDETFMDVWEDKTIEDVAKEVIKGKYGNGLERINNITKLGYNYNEVQNVVNKLMKR